MSAPAVPGRSAVPDRPHHPVVTAPPMTPGQWRVVGSRSTATFRATGFFGLHRVSGSMSVVGGGVSVDETGRPRHVTAAVDAASVLSGNPRRDTQLRGAHFLDTDTHPLISLDAPDVTGDGQGWTVTGELSVRGAAVPVSLAVDATPPVGVDRAWTVTARGQVDLGPTPVGLGGLLSSRVDLEITATLCPPSSPDRR